MENATKQGTPFNETTERNATEIPNHWGRSRKRSDDRSRVCERSGDKGTRSSRSLDIMNKCFKRGLAIITAGKCTMRFAPPLIVIRETIDAGWKYSKAL